MSDDMVSLLLQVCNPVERCPSCEHLLENGGRCGGCTWPEGQRCTITTSSTTILERNPFSLGELDILFEARRMDNVKYLKNWSIAAVKHFEAEKGRLMKAWEKALEDLKVQEARIKELKEKKAR